MEKQDARLEKRAVRLARTPKDDKAQKHLWLTFRLQQDNYALCCGQLISVGLCREHTPLSLYGGLIRGVLNWQGEILGLVDLNYWLGQSHEVVPGEPLGKAILIIGRQQAEWAVPVSQIENLIELTDGVIQQSSLGTQGQDATGLMLGQLDSGSWLLDGQALIHRLDQLRMNNKRAV